MFELSQGNALEKIGYHPEKFRLKREERKIIVKQILEESVDARKEKSNKYTKIKFVKSLTNSREAMFITNEYTYHIILQYEISAIRIKSSDHAQTMELLFDELWDNATK